MWLIAAELVQAPIPKQYIVLLGQPIAIYSLQTLATMPEFGEVVVVCDPSYQVSVYLCWCPAQ